MTLMTYLWQRSREQSDHAVYFFLNSDGDVQYRLSYLELHNQACAIAHALRQRLTPGQRCLLLFPQGIDFVVAFWGCLYARVVPLPVFPPTKSQQSARLLAIIGDSQAQMALTNAAFKEKCLKWLGDSSESQLELCVLSDLQLTQQSEDACSFINEWCEEDLAFIQYSSGSTGTPKGVPIYHRELLENLEQIRQCFHLTKETIGANWLPLYHDMGLVGHLLCPIYVGCQQYFFGAQDFLRKPKLWFEVITRYQVTTSGAPNFAYQYCIGRINDDDLIGVDLSQWAQAYCGAEPIQASTLLDFYSRFAHVGFRQNALLPCYGMAETTLIVSGFKPKGLVANTLEVDKSALEHGVVVTLPNSEHRLVSCGSPSNNTEIFIIDSRTRAFLPENQIGEICVRSFSNARGYWKKPELDDELFLNLDNSAPLLRTGDLGFLSQGELYVTGRLKEMIIIRGRNLYPSDIENLVSKAHPAINSQRIVAFAIEETQGQSLALVAELERSQLRKCNPADVWQAIVKIISDELSIQLTAGALLKPGQLPITSSGKRRRLACREYWENDHWQSIFTTGNKRATDDVIETDKSRSLIEWLREYQLRRLQSQQMDERRSIDPHLLLQLGKRGFFGLNIPAQYGGQGLSQQQTLRVMQQLGAMDVSIAAMLGVHLALAVEPIVRHGSNQQKVMHLPSLARGQSLAAFAISEPNAGANPRSLKSLAKASSTGWMLSGNKCWIGNAGWADTLLVIAKSESTTQQPLGLSAFLVNTEQEGVHIGPEAMTTGMRAMVQNSLWFDRVSLTNEQVLGQVGHGFRIAETAMHTGRLGIMAICVGALRRCCQQLLRHAQERQIASGRLIDQSLIQLWLREGLKKADLIERFSQRIALKRDMEIEVSSDIYAIGKCLAPEWLGETIDQLQQGLGGRGYIEDSLVPQLWRDARLLRIFEGPTETLLSHLGQRLWQQEQELEKAFTEFEAIAPFEKLRAWKEEHALKSLHQDWTYYVSGELVCLCLIESFCQHEDETLFIQSRLQQAFAKTNLSIDRYSETELLALSVQLDSQIGPLGSQKATPPNDIEARLSWQTNAELTENLNASDEEIESPAIATYAAQQLYEEWLINWLQKNVKPSTKVERSTAINSLGLDSIIAVECSVAFEEHWNKSLPVEWFWQVERIDQISALLYESYSPESSSVEPVNNSVSEQACSAVELSEPSSQSSLGLSIFFFGQSEATRDENPYELIRETAEFADVHGFEAIWLPERHFHRFGAAFPDPAVLASALSQVTKNLRLRAGSVVLPLHHPARIAEQWSLVDQLSKGRAGIAITAGWNQNDFVLSSSDAYTNRFESLGKQIQQLRRFWQQEPETLINPSGDSVSLTTYPKPFQSLAPLWLTCNRRKEGFIEAGSLGVNLLTALLSQTEDELAENIRCYRQSLVDSGFSPQQGRVTLMVHCFVHDNPDELNEWVTPALHEYLHSSADLWQQGSKALHAQGAEEREKLIRFAAMRYRKSQALIGSTEECYAKLERWHELGVDEVACLVDFGLSAQQIKVGLQSLCKLVPSKVNPLENTVKCLIPNPQAKYKLLCLTPAGASPYCYFALAQALSTEWELWVLSYQDYDTLDLLLNGLQDQAMALIDRPFSIYGQSFGGLMAFELARKLELSGNQPSWVALAAQHSPTLSYPHNTPSSESDWQALGVNSPMQRVRTLAQLEIQAKEYKYQVEPYLVAPLHLVYGEKDELLEPSQVLAWQEVKKPASVNSLDAKHHFMLTHSSQLAIWIDAWQRSATTKD
ncbi:MupA/Atu3671 family FMN-dependent luciferase-like monooxygenase [Chitinibacter tainanensis]|uniref:MupA/Atu3671 family FMN-dependent luciferase-like monooxygenase n=1 Tax=Chitinibacter tainanensis TaxID=230667 RepID=UPI0003FC6042|nr:MupA/Atu3671 family FMN-dependent luciferase-like monooxygenase [Chitinibacter tainanensis]